MERVSETIRTGGPVVPFRPVDGGPRRRPAVSPARWCCPRSVGPGRTGKNWAPWGDYPLMHDSCGEIRAAISASLDGESDRMAPAEVELHLAGCDACRRWREAAHEVTRQYRLHEVQGQERAPDALRSGVLATVPRKRSSETVVARVALGLAGATQVVVTGRLLMSGDIDSFRDLGSLGVALGVGFLVAAARPQRAIGVRPIVTTAALLLVVSAVLDFARHRTTLSDESPHLIAVVGWLLVMFLAWRTPEFGAPPSVLGRWTTRLWRSTDLRSRRSLPSGGDAVVPTGTATAQRAMRSTGPSTGVTEMPGRPIMADGIEDSITTGGGAMTAIRVAKGHRWADTVRRLSTVELSWWSRVGRPAGWLPPGLRSRRRSGGSAESSSMPPPIGRLQPP